MLDKIYFAQDPARPNTPFSDVRVYVALGMAVIVALLGAMGAWAASIDIAGAVLAPGTVVVDSNVKKVQHPTGGIVGTIHVREGDHVEAGQLLIQLDETVARASLQMIQKQLDEIAVRQARLKAEQEDRSEIAFPAAILGRRNEPILTEIITSETTLFENRRIARQGLESQLEERKTQLHEEIKGLTAQQSARGREHEYAQAELVGLEELDGKSLVSTPRITAARRNVAQLEGDIAQVTSAIAQAKGKIAEIELQILQLDQQLKIEVSRELREQQGRESELSERRIVAEDQLRRIEIRAPQRGTVHQLAVHTVGGVIGPSEVILMIVPAADRLVIDAKIAPQDIDQIKLGQTAHVRFSAFNQRTTPDVSAVVARVSADLMVGDPSSETRPRADSLPYYNVRLALSQEAQEKLGALHLIPGMPAEVFIATAERTALSYFTKPLTDQFERAFRER